MLEEVKRVYQIFIGGIVMSKGDELINLSPQEFVQFLKDQHISRFYFVYEQETKQLISSHPQLQSLAAFLQADKRDFMEHEGMFFQVSRQYDTLQGAFIHRTNRGPGIGGLRYWHYETMEGYLRDGLRLSKGMTRKNALSGLWWGGGKGVIAHNEATDKTDPEVRASLFQEYGRLTSSLRGCYVTGEDVGTNVTDMAKVFSQTRFTVCIPPALGGSGNPSIATARGIICGMEAALKFIVKETLRGKTVAVQGMGNVGEALVRLLFEKGVKKVIASDIDPDLVERVKTEMKGKNLEARVTPRGDKSFLGVECDILAPCALGAILNPVTIPQIKTRIVCGAANNQLEDAERDDRLMHERGIIYLPDFLINRMGIVNSANEQYGYVRDDPLIGRHLGKDWEFSIYQMVLKVLQRSCEAREPSARIAIEMADKLSLENHPIIGHRGQQIIASMVADRWHET
jgi:leucine dehydrogenase